MKRILSVWLFAHSLVQYFDGDGNYLDFAEKLFWNDYRIYVRKEDMIDIFDAIRSGICCRTLGTDTWNICASFYVLYMYLRGDYNKGSAVAQIKGLYNPVPGSNYTGAVLRKAFDECEHALTILCLRYLDMEENVGREIVGETVFIASRFDDERQRDNV
ncbi:hypothetical protein BHU09_08670 [Tannerella sp. oral taxon 808]|nr:hypothetical protein BHU09_08670 [Tannerella sp. oral taxon 808]